MNCDRAKIERMKMLWIYMMLGSLGVFVGTFVPALYRYDSNGADWVAIVLSMASAIFLGLAALAFIRARGLGREEDRLRDLWRR